MPKPTDEEVTTLFTSLGAAWAVLRNTREFQQASAEGSALGNYWREFDTLMGQVFKYNVEIIKARHGK